MPQSESDDTTEGSVTRNRVGSTGDVVGVRPYRRGDSPRRIHWAQSARHDRLIVCELQSSSRPVVVILLDADPATHTPGADGSREWAIRVAASFVRGWLREGAMVGLVTSTGVVPPASGESQLTRVMDHLARLPSGSSKQHDAADLRTLLRHPGFAVPGAVRVVVVSDAGFSRAARNPSLRWVVLDRRGFAGEDSHAPSANCEEAPERHRPTPWLDIDSKHKLEFLLRQGWSEARHGS